MSRTYTARWVFPVSGPPLRNGTVTVRGGRIRAVQPFGERRPNENFGNAAIVPGFVNAHTHLDLSGACGAIPPTDPDRFTDWLRGVIAYRRSRSAVQTQADIRAGLAECLRFGTTLIGDIASDGASWAALAEASARAVVFRELIGLSPERARASWNVAQDWYRTHLRVPTCRPAFSPHAPYSASADLQHWCSHGDWPVAIHLAESPGELELIGSRSGPFVSFLQELGVWEPDELITSLDTPIVRVRIARRALFVHGNYLSADLAQHFHAWMSVVYCPRTHAAFGHPPHPFRELLARGARVCLGTDSLASNPDLDILAEARFVRTRYPDFPGDQLLRMITLSGAEALGWADECGSLEFGKSADFVVVPLPSADASDPHELLFAEHAGERRTMFRGEFRSTP